jgi:hypothetical protein
MGNPGCKNLNKKRLFLKAAAVVFISAKNISNIFG